MFMTQFRFCVFFIKRVGNWWGVYIKSTVVTEPTGCPSVPLHDSEFPSLHKSTDICTVTFVSQSTFYPVLFETHVEDLYGNCVRYSTYTYDR